MIVTLTGPSCAGKSTLEKMLVERGFSNAVSTTTRPPRPGETHGENYYFHGRALFEHGIREGHYVEHVEFGGNYYGLSVAEVRRLQALDKHIVVVCEPIGQKQIAAWCKANDLPIYAVFVDNPEQVIANRFMERAAKEFIGVTDVGLEVQVPSLARRLKEMTTTERGWVAEAWSSDLYNLRLSEFNEGNDELVADMIARIVNRQVERVMP